MHFPANPDRPKRPPECDRLLLRVREACEMTATPRSRGYEYVRSGEWPSVRCGRAIRIPRAGLDAWIAHKLDESENQ